MAQGRNICLERGIQTPMAQDRSAKTISMIEWIRMSRLSIKSSLSHEQLLSGAMRLVILVLHLLPCAGRGDRIHPENARTSG